MGVVPSLATTSTSLAICEAARRVGHGVCRLRAVGPASLVCPNREIIGGLATASDGA